MHRRDDLKTWLTEVGSLYGAVVVFVSLSFLLTRLDGFLAASDTAPEDLETETLSISLYSEYPH